MPITCYLDAFSGISGDMLVGALADAGADQAAITDAIASLDAGAAVSFEKVKRAGIGATKFHVAVQEHQDAPPPLPIVKMIERANLAEPAKRNAIASSADSARRRRRSTRCRSRRSTSTRWARSIPSPISWARASRSICWTSRPLFCSPLNVGSGTVKTEHGLLPVPAPATARLLTGVPVYARGPALELTTPTGAAVAVTLADALRRAAADDDRAHRVRRGRSRFPEQANVLRVILGELTGADEALTVSVIEANIDDLNPQVLAYATERLLESGALDVTLQPMHDEEGPRPAPCCASSPSRRIARRSRSIDLRRNLHARRAHLPRRAPRAGAHASPKSRRRTARSASKFERGRLRARVRRLPQAGARNRRAAQADHRRSQLRLPETNQMKYYLTTPLYYVNAAPHIGHTYTTMAADTIARFKRMQGYDAVMFTGTDEHGQKVERAAEAAGQDRRRSSRDASPPNSARSGRCSNSSGPLPAAPPTRRHHKVVQWLFERCLDNGYIYKGSYTGQYCVFDELYVNEAKPGDPCPDLRPPHRDRHRRELLLQALGVPATSCSSSTRRNPNFIQPETRRNEVHLVRQGRA